MPEQVFYKNSGKGTKVILLHGFCETSEIWWKIAPALAQHCEVIMPDLPGFGRSPLPEENEITIDRIAEIIYSSLSGLSDQDFYIFGHSLGGYITLAIADQFPQKIKGIGLINSTAFPDDENKKSNRLKTIEFIKKKGKAVFLESFVPGLFFKGRKGDNSSSIEEALKIARKTSEAAMISYTLAMRNRPTRLHLLKSSNVPVMMIAGKEDQVIPADKSLEQINFLKDGHGHLMKDCGHMCMVEEPEITAKHLLDFIRYSSQ